MAMITCGDVEKEVHSRIKEAIKQSPLSQAALIASLVIENKDEAQQWYFERVLTPALEFYQPISICDPCCGSGVMFLAAASAIPEWITSLGLVQFFGCDIDQGCVLMARIQCRLYGLNGSGALSALSLSKEQLDTLPEGAGAAYAAAQEASAAGDEERVQQIAAELRQGIFSQAAFDFAEA